MIKIQVNGKEHTVTADGDTPLLWVLRENLGLTGTKYSCGIGECGACTVHVEGEAIRSCTVTLEDVQGKSITTIEGLQGPVADALFKAWEEGDVPQCGYCQPGQIMQATNLLEANPNPNDKDIDEAMSGNLCRCGTYENIRKAIHRAAGELGS